MTTPFTTHAYHRFRKAQLQRPECAAIAEPLREAWIESLWVIQRQRGQEYVDRGPRLGAPSAEWTGPNGNRYIFVPGEAP